jgi:cell division septation protein DedD
MRDQDDDRTFEPRERRRERGPGLGLSLVGAGLLTAVGFALGVVVGASFEDPDLLVGSIAGRGEEVQLGAGADPGPVAAAPPPLGVEADGPPPDFAAAPEGLEQQVDAGDLAGAGAFPESAPLGTGVALPPLEPEATPPPAAPAAPAPPPALARRPAPERVAAVSGSGFSVQVGAFQDRPPAAALSDRLERGGFPAYVSGNTSGGQRWRVRVGPVATRSEADALARRLKREEGLPTWVVADGR